MELRPDRQALPLVAQPRQVTPRQAKPPTTRPILTRRLLLDTTVFLQNLVMNLPNTFNHLQVNLMDLRRCQDREGLLTIRDTKLPSLTPLKLTCNSSPERKGHHPKCIRASLFLVKVARKRAILTSDGLVAIRNNFTIVKSAKFLVPVPKLTRTTWRVKNIRKKKLPFVPECHWFQLQELERHCIANCAT